jgi:hypothetical protein
LTPEENCREPNRFTEAAFGIIGVSFILFLLTSPHDIFILRARLEYLFQYKYSGVKAIQPLFRLGFWDRIANRMM